MSHPLTSHTPDTGQDAGRDAALAGDLAELRRRNRIEGRARVAIAAGFVMLAAAVAGPPLASVPAWMLASATLVGLAVVGAAAVLTMASGWLEGRYEVTRPHPWRVWRWRVTARWYAPGAIVWRTDTPAGHAHAGLLTVLGWHADPACAVPWVLVYDGTPRMSGGAAVWLPLTALAPTPPPSPPGPPPSPCAGAGFGGPR